MAVTYVGVGTPDASTTSTVAPGMPGSLTTDDLLFFVYGSRGSPPTAGSLTGWTSRFSASPGSTGRRLQVFTIPYSGSTPGDIIAASSVSGGDNQISAIFALRGVDLTTPLGDDSGITGNTGTANIAVDAGTGDLTLPAGSAVIVMGVKGSNSGTGVDLLTGHGLDWSEIVDIADAGGNTIRMAVQIGINNTGSSVTVTDKTLTVAGSPTNSDSAALMFAVAAVATGDAGVTAVPADALGDIPAPTVSGEVNATTTSPVADALGDLPIPAVSAGSDVTSPTLDGLGDLPVPAVEGSAAEWEDLAGETGDDLVLDGDHVGYEIRCVVTASNAAGDSGPEPSNELGPVTASDDATVTAPALDATGVAPAPTVTAGSDVTSPTLDATGDLPVPVVASSDWQDISGETGDTYELEAGDVGYELRCVVVASNAAGDSDPEVSNVLGPVEEGSDDAEVIAPPLGAAGDIPTPSTPISMEVTSGQLSATGDLPVPTVTGTTDATVTSPTADGTGDMPAPTVTAGADITAPTLDGLGDLPVPSVTGSAQGEVVSPPLDATGAIPAPSVSGGHTITSPTLDATGDVPLPDSIGAPNPIGPSVGIGVETFLAAWRSTGDTGFPSYGQAEPGLAGSAQAETGIAASAYAETLLVLA